MVRYYRRVLKIQATDSPNVRLALAEQEAGLTPSGKQIVPGVLAWHEYQKRLATWDEIRQCIGLRGEFYEGSETLLYPPDWLNRSEQEARALQGKPRYAKAIGIDTAEGGDNSCWAVVDDYGLLELISKKTPDTSVIPGDTLALMRKWNVAPENVLFDQGGGGRPHADRLRSQGFHVRTVAFGEPVKAYPSRARTRFDDRFRIAEDRYVYCNRRSQMYGELRLVISPMENERPFAIPEQYVELRRQLAPIPLTYDGEGRLRLLPKRKNRANSTEKTLEELLGCSPDEADSLVLAVHGMLHAPVRTVAGGF